MTKHVNMNVKEHHDGSKGVSAAAIFKGEEGTVLSMQIKAGERLKEHISKTPAVLICLEGKVTYEGERGENATLLPGDYFLIDPMVLHWVDGIEDSQLLLVK